MGIDSFGELVSFDCCRSTILHLCPWMPSLDAHLLDLPISSAVIATVVFLEPLLALCTPCTMFLTIT